MKLFLTSSGITNKSIENALLDLLGKPFEKAHLTFVPTAANVEKGDKSWLVDDMYNFKKLGFSTFDIVDIAAVDRAIWYPSFTKADVLVFGGGNVYYLLEWIKKSKVFLELPELIKTKVYVGISAGSMVTASNIFLATSGILYYEETGGVAKAKGLGFVDFEIRPHLNSEWFPKVRLSYLEELASKTKNSFYAIDDDTALTVIDGDVSVVAEGEWKKFD